MTEIYEKCLDVFPGWLESLGSDVKTLQECYNADLETGVKRTLVGGINYLFKSLDLIPDGIDNIGYLDDAIVIRIAARIACDAGIDALNDDQKTRLGKLADDVFIVKELMGDDLHARLADYVADLADGSARGRSVDDILEDETVARELAQEIEGFISEYETPAFEKDEKNIIRLKSFIEAKLPQ
jgi:uncharacterized membrane protein YkvA (DUF1232 family)